VVLDAAQYQGASGCRGSTPPRPVPNDTCRHLARTYLVYSNSFGPFSDPACVQLSSAHSSDTLPRANTSCMLHEGSFR
jgi:hypothetical protein